MNSWQSHGFWLNIVCIISLLSVYLVKPYQVVPKYSNLNTITKWKLIDHKIEEMSDFIFEKVFSMSMDSKNRLNITTRCTKESLKLLNGLRNLESWALKFFDSSAKSIDSLMGATTSSLGAYHECLEIKAANKKRPERIFFKGQYCLIGLTPPMPSENEMHELIEIAKNFSSDILDFSIDNKTFAELEEIIDDRRLSLIRLGVCVPSGCSEEDVWKVLNRISEKFYLRGRVYCEVKKSNEYATTQILAISYFAFIGILAFIGTSLDIYCRNQNISFSSKLGRILMGFSFISNSKKILDTNAGDEKLGCTNGIRVVTCSWIILSHTILQMFPHVNFSPRKFYGEFVQDAAFQVGFLATFQVDTFFFLGGFFVAYKNLAKKNNFNILDYVVTRIFRILPTYFSILMLMPLLNYWSSGPMLHDLLNVALPTKRCAQEWWKNLLFINNFSRPEKMCLTHTWYLAADFQLYVASLIIILPLLRWPSFGVMLGIFGILSSMTYVGITTYIQKLTPFVLYNARYLTPSLFLHVLHFYYNSFTHAGIYIIGILTGKYFLKNPEISLSKKIQLIGWITACAPNLILVYYPVFWNRGKPEGLFSFVLYGIFGRTCWGLGLAWVVICCSTGHGGIVNKVLSWKAFVPLSRLTFIAYLIQPFIEMCYLGSTTALLTFSYLSFVWLYLASTIVILLAAFGCSAMIEMPFINLQSIIWPRKISKKELSKR